MNNAPIGIFDSGVGGLSVWHELRLILPHEATCYVADSANCPYGEKSPEEITALSLSITDFLLSKTCKIIVVACNTATSAAIQTLRQHYPETIFVGIEPATKPAALQTHTGKIGVIATQGTLRSEKFHATRQRFAQNIEVFIQVGYGLVELVEQGRADSPEAQQLLEKYLLPMLAHGVDQIVLGCTHYPFLLPTMQRIVGDKAHIINPAIAVARHTKHLLVQAGLLNPTQEASGKYDFYTNASPEILKNMLHHLDMPKNPQIYLANEPWHYATTSPTIV